MNTTKVKKEVKLTSLESLGNFLPSKNKKKYYPVKIDKDNKEISYYENRDNCLARTWDLSPWERTELADIYLKKFYWLPKRLTLENKEDIIRPIIKEFREKVRKNRCFIYKRNETFIHHGTYQEIIVDNVIVEAIKKYCLSRELALKLSNNPSLRLWLKSELK